MIIDELKDFRSLLMRFVSYRKKQIMDREKLTPKEESSLVDIYEEISISAGKYASLVKEFTGLETIQTSAGLEDVWNWAFSFSYNTLVLTALDKCLQATSRTIGSLQEEIKKGVRDKETGLLVTPRTKKTTEPPKAFIAHEGETRALTMLKEFLEAFGIHYFIAESKASGGRSIERQVDWTQSEADFAICLATKGKAINKKTGKHYMAPNIIDELGRARQVFGNKIILLVQKGVEVHTNIREIVYETFTTTNMERAFIKIAKELTNWGFITVGITKE